MRAIVSPRALDAALPLFGAGDVCVLEGALEHPFLAGEWHTHCGWPLCCEHKALLQPGRRSLDVGILPLAHYLCPPFLQPRLTLSLPVANDWGFLRSDHVVKAGTCKQITVPSQTSKKKKRICDFWSSVGQTDGKTIEAALLSYGVYFEPCLVGCGRLPSAWEPLFSHFMQT